ncbi:unnamed protein product [Arabis nemorensis]|uniref:NYN domain-containing protein n=1 Tax=Arabis nemorensis TaxID=586526 RepID=A0A565BYX8_9BRAS|nr:unnamed protein product [Arabis nemorensis]
MLFKAFFWQQYIFFELELMDIPKPLALPTSFVPFLEPPPPPVFIPLEKFFEKYIAPITIGPPEINKKAVTSVFWDINKCPVPPRFYLDRVGPYIRRYMKNRGYSGRLTITVVGELTKESIFPVVSSIVSETGSSGIRNLVHGFTNSNPPPANIMVISNEETVIPPRRYNCLPTTRFEDILWAGALEDKRSETGELVCTVCDHASQGYENFITHLSSRPHERKMLDSVPNGVRMTYVTVDILT